MRALREHPRVTIAKGLAVLLVFGLGIAFGVLLSGDGQDVPPETATALERARSAAGTRADDLAEARAEVARLERRIGSLERRLRRGGARNRRITRALRTARRQLAELEP